MKWSLWLTLLISFVSVHANSQEFQPPTSGFQDPVVAFPYGSALQGLRVVVSPGHGWQGDTTGGFQRSNHKFVNCGTCDGITEDIYNAEFCTDHLVPMLRQAGARVYVVRQFDRQEVAMTIDDGDPGYGETGTWGDGTNGSLGWQGDYRTLNGNIEGAAVWTLDVPVEGDYWVQMRWAAGTNRCPDVRVQVDHAGGTASFVLNQQIDGSMWVPLARLHFNQGEAVVRMDHPPVEGCYIIADAVRLGGGVDAYSGRPWWQVSSLDWLGETGPSGISVYNDVTVRPQLANYLGADVYLSFHGNANDNASARGTATYRYNCQIGDNWSPLDPELCDDPVGSAGLQYLVQDHVMDFIWSGWDPAFQDDGPLAANFGELRELETTPGVMVESAYFTNLSPVSGQIVSDNQSMHDPRFRRAVAGGIVSGLISFVNPDAPSLPEPPKRVSLVNDGQGGLVLQVESVAGARGFRAWRAVNGRGYDNGTLFTGSSLTIGDAAPGSVVTVRVTALNESGESMPSPAVSARVGSGNGPVEILLVNAFDRQDAWVREDYNHRDYVVEHALALADAGHVFDGAMDDAALGEEMNLEEYIMFDWVLGRESVESETFSDTQQQRLRAVLAGGNSCLVASGTEIAWDLDYLGSATDRDFLNSVFGASYQADDAKTRHVLPDLDGIWADMSDFMLDDGSGTAYDARYPDVFATVNQGESILSYPDGGVAAVFSDSSNGRAVLLGFPIETVVGRAVRADLVSRIAVLCGVDSSGSPDGAEPADSDAQTGGDQNGFADNGGSAGDVIEVFDDAGSGDTGTDSAGAFDTAVTDDGLISDSGADVDIEFSVDSGLRPDSEDTSGASDAALWEFPGLVDVSGTEGGGGGGCSVAAASGQGGAPGLFVTFMLVAVIAGFRFYRRRSF